MWRNRVGVFFFFFQLNMGAQAARVHLSLISASHKSKRNLWGGGETTGTHQFGW